MITTLKTHKELQKEKISSAKFEEATDCKIIRKGQTDFYDWYQIYKSPNLYLFRELNKIQFEYVKNEINLYKKIRDNPSIYKNLASILPKYIKVAQKKDSTAVEILQEYSGIPLSEFSLSNDEIEETVKIELMERLLIECIQSLIEADIVHGELCPENILFEIEYGKVTFLCGNSITQRKDIKANGFRPILINSYNHLFYGSNPQTCLSPDEAVKADISAIALSIYQLGMKCLDKNPHKKIADIMIKTGSKEDKLHEIVSISHIFSENDKRIKDLFVSLINGRTLQECQKIITDYMNPNNLDIIKSYQTCKETDKKFRTKVKTDIKVKKLRNNNKIFLALDEPPFIIKVNDKKYVEIEMQVLKHLSNQHTECLAQAMRDIVPDPGELAIEYKGVDIESKFIFIGKEIILDHIPSIVKNIMLNLHKANIYHADIKSKNISIDIHWTPYLFDYDISSVLDKSKKTTDKQSVPFLGISYENASPEAIEYSFSNKGVLNLEPYKSDLYSLARALVLSLHKKTKISSVIKSFYNQNKDANTINESNMHEYINKHIKNPNGYNLPTRDECMGLFFLENCDEFAEEVKNHDDIHLKKEEKYHIIMKFLSKALQRDPAKRPSYDDLIKECDKHIKEFSYTDPNFKADYSQIQEEGWEIEYLSKRYIYPKLHSIASIILPTVTNSNDTYISKYVLIKDEANNVTQFKNEKQLFRTKTFHLCRFIQLYNLEKKAFDLYVTGGIDDEYNQSPNHYIVSLQEGKLIQKQSMHYSRSEFGLTTIGNWIIVAGGSGDKMDNGEEMITIPLNTIERYDSIADKWDKFPLMQTGRISPCLICHSSNRLYVIGGTHPSRLNEESKDRDIICSTIESYDLSNSRYIKEERIKTTIYCTLFDIIFMEKGRSSEELMFVRSFPLTPPDKRSNYISDTIIEKEIYCLNLASLTIKKDETPQDESLSYLNSYNELMFEECALILPKYIYQEQSTSKAMQIFNYKTNKINTIMGV